MQGSGFHQQHRHGTFHTDESSPAAAIVSLLTGRDVLRKQSQTGHDDEADGDKADSYQEKETARGWEKWLKLP